MRLGASDARFQICSRFKDCSHATYEDSPYFHSVWGNQIDGPIQRLVDTLIYSEKVDVSQEPLLHQLLVPFKLLAMLSAQELPLSAKKSSLRRFPKELCRIVRGMLL
jgi:hypothetical protein